MNSFKINKNIFNNMKSLFLEIYKFRNVLLQLIRQYLRLKYRRTVFGYFWTLLNPLLILLVLGIVFSSLLKIDLEKFIFILFAGLVPWNLFSQSIIQSLNTYINNEGLIKKIYIPKILFPLSVSLALVIDTMFFFIVTFPFMFFLGAKLSLAILVLPLALILLFLFSLGLTIIGSITTVFFRDFQWLIPVLLQALFFLSPIIYDKGSVIGILSLLNNLNPLSPFLELFKLPLLLGQFPSLSSWTLCLIFSLTSILVGLSFHIKLQKKIIYRL